MLKFKVIDNDYYNMLKEDLDSVIACSPTLKYMMFKIRKLSYKAYIKNDIITIYQDGMDKVRIEKTFGPEYSLNRIKEKLYSARPMVYKPMSQKSIFNEYSKTNKTHKGIYGLYLYYCYLLGVFPKKYPKQYLPYSIRKDIKELDEFSKQTSFMVEYNIETEEDFYKFYKDNNEHYNELVGLRENLWKRYNRAKTDEKKNDILTEINNIQSEIKKLREYNKMSRSIEDRSKSIEDNLNNFDIDTQKEKDNSRSLD